MNSTIWKQALKPEPVQQVELPIGAEILCAREQFNDICIWYRCDPTEKMEPRTIAICGTGHKAPHEKESRYLGTASLHGGNYIYHVFERTR